MDEDKSVDLFSNCQFREPASEEAVAAAEARLGMPLPDEYLRILAFSDGFEGPLGDSKVAVNLWKVEELYDENVSNETSRLMPGRILIGTTNSNEGICIDLRDASETAGYFFMVPLDPLDWDDAEPLGPIVEEAFAKLMNPFSLPADSGTGTKPLSDL